MLILHLKRRSWITVDFKFNLIQIKESDGLSTVVGLLLPNGSKTIVEDFATAATFIPSNIVAAELDDAAGVVAR